MYYADSLARVYGKPGCGKSFMVLDQALSFATGSFWYGEKLERSRVIYVMAEGQSVNRDRAEAWLSKHGKEQDDLEDWFWVVPDALQLTEIGVKPFVDVVAQLQPALVFLDTKNAMMVGEENSASDFARMRRSLDMIRKASGCCVVIVDHTGYEGTRARGSSAATAGMDTEIRVTMDDEQRPAIITAELTRDKAGETGGTWTWRLMPEYPAAVLERCDVPAAACAPAGIEWVEAESLVPDRVRRYDGQGKNAIVDLTKLMAFETSMTNDPHRLGRTFSDAARVLKESRNHPRATVQRAWSQLKDMGLLESTFSDPTETQDRTGPHIWSGPSGVTTGSVS